MPQSGAFKCDSCGTEFSTHNALDAHKAIHQRPSELIGEQAFEEKEAVGAMSGTGPETYQEEKEFLD